MINLISKNTQKNVVNGFKYYATSFLFASSAWAGSDFSFYGVVDTSIGWTKVSGESADFDFIDNGQTDSVLGIWGEVELSDDLKIILNLESGFLLSEGSFEDTDNYLNQAAWLGLEHSDFGTLTLGRQNTLAQRFGDEVEIASWADFGLGALFKASDNYQVANSISYLTPSLSGLQAGISYSFNANKDVDLLEGSKFRSLSLALSYELDSLYAFLSYDRLALSKRVEGKSFAATAFQAGFSYDFSLVKLATGFSRQSKGFIGLNGGEFDAPHPLGMSGLGAPEFIDSGRLDAYFIGVSLPLGSHEVVAQYSYASPDWVWQETGKKAKKAQVASLGYVYSLSDETSLYAYVAAGSNFSPESVLDENNSKLKRVAFGVTHSF